MAPIAHIVFVGAGPGDPDLLTVKGARALGAADMVVYTGSVINPAMLNLAKPSAARVDSAGLTLDEIVAAMIKAAKAGKAVVRLHDGDPSIFGALGEQLTLLEQAGVTYEIIPGVTSSLAAAARLGIELTRPEVTQTVIISRCEGRTKLPARESLASLAEHRATLILYLSVQRIAEVTRALAEHYPPTTPAAVVYRATWPDERVFRGTVGDIAAQVQAAGIERTALIFVGDGLKPSATRSRLYDETFEHGFRKKRSRSTEPSPAR